MEECWFPRVLIGCVHGGVEKDCVGGEEGLLEAGWDLGTVRDARVRLFSQSSAGTLLCPPMETLKMCEAGGRGGGGKRPSRMPLPVHLNPTCLISSDKAQARHRGIRLR